MKLRTRVRKEGWKDRYNAFLVDLENGKLDPDLDESEMEPTLPIKEPISASESGMVEGMNGPLANVEETKSGGDDEMQFPIDGEEDPADNDGVRGDTNGKISQDPKRGASRGEEVSVPPEGNQIMIRTIPPDIGRAKLEEVIMICSEDHMC